MRLVLQFFILGSKRLHRKLNDKVKSRFDCFALYKATGKIKTKISFEKLKHSQKAAISFRWKSISAPIGF